MEPPAFRGAPQTVRAAPGAAAVLQFPIPAGTPPFHYQWSRAGASLDERFVSSDDAGGVRLTVTSSRASDGGVYTLQASNAAGSDTARVRLEIAEEAASGEDPPTFLRRLQDLTVKVGTRTRFLVEIVSSTECKVTWYRNERRLMEAERVSLVRDGNFWCADVAAVSVDDAGRWTCAAENAGGRASCSAHLNVLVPKAYKRPEFVEELRAILTEQGTVSLECKVIGVPTPVLRWFKDSREIKAGDVFALTASAEDPTSLGTYTCEAVNCMGRTYSSSKVHVTRGSESRPSSSITPEPPPIFTKELEDQFVRICEHLSLGCHIVVPPWPRSVVWYNKEGKVEAGDRYHVTEDGVGGYLLEVQSAEWPDEGEWKCVATSAGGRVGISTCHVVMDVPKNYRKPRFMENLQAVLTEEGLVSFECKVVGFPTPVLSWFKDGQELKPGDVYQLTGTNSLGSYCCIARNCMGQASSSAELTVEDIQNQLNEEEKLQLFTKNQAPKFVQGLKSVEAKIDEPFRFTIKVAIPPEPSVLWYRDDQPVDESNRCHLSKEDRGVFTLDIQNLEFLDQAEWKCVAMNDFGHSVTSCFLKLIIPRHYKKPRFLENLQAILSEEGAVNLECKVIGVPQPVLKWYKDGEELKPGDIHRIISGQDGTCCLGTYTCEAQNCMGIAASSASLLGFDDSMKTKKRIAEEQALQRNLSLSTIHEERTSQMYDTPVGDITLDDKGEISFSFDGKEVSVSLYETPDLTEEEALQIVEMYADQLSENVTEHNVVELPPLRFVKETSTSGNLLMEAIIIDVSPEYFASPEEDLRTEADVEDLSIADENGVPQLSLDQDVGGEDYLEKTMALLSEEKADIPKKISRKKSDSLRSGEDFFSLSRDQSISEEKRADDTQVLSESDLQSFASARSYDKQKSKSSKPSLEDDKESSETKTILHKEEVKIVKETKSKKKEDKSEVVETKSDVKEVEKKRAETETPVMKPKRERRGSRSSRRSSSGSEKSYSKAKEELIQVKAEVESKPKISDDEFKTKINEVSSTLSKVINDVQIIERDIILKSELMSSAATASRSLEIISNLITPLSEIQSVSEAAKECKEIKEVSSLFNNLPQSMKALQQSLNLVEKCIDMEGENKTLVKKTCIAFIETCGNEIQKVMSEINSIAETDYLQTEEVMIKEVQVLTNEMNNAIKYSSDTIKTRSLLSEASEVKTDETSADAKHLKDTQKAVFELRSPLNSLLCIAESADSEKMVDLAKIKNSEVILNDMSASIQDLQTALEQIESLSVKESMSSLNKYNTEIIETVMDSVLKLRISFENLSTETKIEDDKAVLKKALASIKQNLSEISTHIDKIESNIGNFDILQSDNKLEVLQKMAQILIALENNLPYLETIPEVKLRLDIFHKNLTKVLENVIETNEAKKYFALIEICDVVNRINTAIKTIHSDRILSLASLNNTLRIVQDHFINNVFDSELNCAILTNITDALVDIQETINQADEISVNIDSEHIQDIQDFSTYGTGKANVVLERIEHTIVAVSNIKLMECTTDLKEAITPALENICPVLEKLKQSIASIASNRVEQEEHVSDISDVSVAKTLATPLCELNQNIMVINQTIVENIESLKENSEVFVTVAEPLRELHTTLEILQQVVISQYGEDVTPYDVSVNIANAVQNLQSCIVMIREQGGIEFADEMSTLEDISGIKTTADTLPSDRLILPTGTETRTEQEAGPFHQDLPTSATAQALQSLNDHITVLQNPEIIDALDTLSEVSDYSSLKSVVLGLGELHSGIQELLHPFILETSNEITSINTSKLMAIAEPLQDLQQCLSVLDATNIPIYEHILEMPTEKIHSVFQSITEFKDNLDKCIHVVFPAMDNADKTIEISNKVETLRVVCEHLKDIIENTKAISTEAPVKQEVIALEETVKNLLDATDVSKGIKIEQVKCVTQELYENVTKVQEELIQFTPQTPDKLAQEAKLIQIIDKVERNIAVLEEYDFVDLSRASDMSCASPQIAVEVETDTLLQMDDVVQCAVGIIQDSSDDTPVADLMIVEDFFKNCRNEFALLRCLLNNKLSHKRIIRLLQEFSVLKQTISDFKIKQTELHLADDISNSLITFFGYCDDCLNSVQESLIKIVDSQADLLFKAPITKLENTKEVLSDILVSSKFTPLEDVAKRFVNVIDIAGPCLQRAEVSIRDEIKNNAIIVEDKALITAMDDAETFVEEQILTKSELTVESREILQNILDCIQKHHDYKDAVGSGKTLILLKCLSECSDILQEKITETKAEAKVHKFEDTALKVVLAEMLVPLQALHHQLINVQEQVLTGVEDDVSIDLTSTESFAQAMGEIQQEIKQLEQHVHEGTVVDSVEKTMILEIDKEIHTIQDSIRSIDNVNSAEKEKVSKPMEEIEKSLHTLLATEAERKQDIDINSNVDSLESALNRSLAIDKASVDSLTSMTGVNLNEIIEVAQELKKLIQDKENPKFIENKNEKIKNLESLLSQFDWVNSDSDKLKEYDKLNDALLTMYQLLKACNVDSKIVEAEEEKPTEIIQHVDKCIELIEIVEEISTIINLDNIKESANLAKELRENVASVEIEINKDDTEATKNVEKLKEKNVEIAIKLKDALASVQVQVLESTKELQPELKSEVVQRIQEATAQLQADFVNVDVIKSVTEQDSKTEQFEIELAKKDSMTTALEVQQDKGEKQAEAKTITQDSQKSVDHTEIDKIKDEETERKPVFQGIENVSDTKQDSVIYEKVVETEVAKKICSINEIESKSPVIVESFEIITTEQLSTVETCVSIVVEGKSVDTKDVTEAETAQEKVSKEEAVPVQIKEEKATVSTAVENAVLVQHIEELISPQVTKAIELVSKVIDVTEIKESIAMAKELKEILSEVVKETSNEDIVQEQAKLVDKLQEAFVAFQAVALENAEAIEKKLDASEWKAVTEVVVQLKDDLSKSVEATAVDENAVLVQHIEELISPQVTQSIELASKVIDVTEIKESIAVAKELKESLSEVVKETANEDIVKEQAKLKGKLQEALVAFQAVAVENAEAIEKKLDASEWKAVTEVVVQLRDDLLRGVEATVVSENAVLVQHIEELISPQVTQSIELASKVIDVTEIKESIAVAKELKESLSEVVKETANEDIVKEQAKLKGKLQEALVAFQAVAVENAEAIEKKLDASEWKAVTEVVVQLQDDLLRGVEATVVSENAVLVQHIEELISPQVTQSIELASKVIDVTEIKESIAVAKELKESLSEVVKETANEDIVKEQAKLKGKLQEALVAFQAVAVENAEAIEKKLDASEWKAVTEVVVQLQDDLSRGVEATVIAELPTEKTEASLNHLETLLQEVTISIGTERTTDDTESLRDNLDEIQTVIIKLKRDYDGANDTLNETLEDLECSVRSVQLQINEDSPPEMLKEACATLQLLVNNMSSTEDISGTVVKEIKTENLLEKCSNDTEATVQLLNIAMRDNKQLEKIVANLNVLRDIMKNLRSSFLNDADTLIDRGIEVLQSLDQVEEKVFALEKDIGDIPGSVKDSILNAVHSVYGSISNMRSTVQSIQKRYMFENYGKPSEEILKSIKNVTKADGDKKWKTLAKSLRKVLNHFEDIKFYINLDKTARLPSDAAFTKIILNELKMILNESVKPFSDDHSKVTTSYKAVLNCLEENLAKIESLTSLEVKEKIPVLKAIAPLLLKMTYTIATCCEDNNEEDILIDVNKLPELNKEKASEIENQGVSQQIEAQVKDKLEIKTELSEGKVLDTEKEPIETQQELTNSEKQVTKKTELIIETQKAVDDQNSLQLVNQSSSTDTKVSETVEMQLKTDNTTNKEPSVTAKEQKNAADLTEEKIPQEREEISKEEVEIGKVSSETDERNEISTEVESKYEQPSTSQLLISQKDTKLTQQEKLETVEKERDGIETKKKKDDKQAKVINHDENELAKGSKETKDDKIKISTEREEKTTETLHQQEGDITVEKEEIIVDRQTKDEENEQVKADVTEILKVQQEGAIGALVENQKEIEEAQIIKLKEEEAEVSESKAKKQEEGAKVAVEKQKQEEKAKIDKQNKEKEAKIENQNEAKKAEAQKQIEEEEINAKTKERNEADANKFKDKEDSKETEQKEKNKANAKKHKEEEETKSKIQKEDTESVSKKQAEKEEAKITNQKEEEEKAAKVKKEKEDEITTKKLKEEEEAKTKNHKEEEAPSAIKQKEEDNRATKQADEEIKSIKVIEVEETTSKKLEEKEEALVLKQKEEDTTKTRNQKDDEEAEAKQLKDEQEAIAIKQKKEEEEAKAIKLKEDELKASSFKEEQEADAAKLKEEQEAKAKKQKQEEEAKAIKQKEETEAKKHKEEQEAKTKKQKEEEEAKVKKQKEEEEVKAIKQKEEEEAIAKKLKEEQEAKAEKQKEEEEAKIKKQKEEEAEAKKQIEEEETKAKKQKEKAEAKKLKEGEELENNKQKEEEEVKAKEKKEEEENKAKKLKKKKEANAKIQKEEEEAKLNKQKEEEEANALKQNEVEAKKLKEEQEAVAKKQKEEEEENNKNQKEEEEAKAIKQKDEEERQAQKLKEEQEAKAKKQKEEEAKAKKQKEEEEAKAKKLKEEEETIAKKLKEEQDTKVKKQKEEEEAKVKEQKEEAEIKAKKQKEEKEAEAKKQKDEEEAKIKKQKEEKDAKAVKQKEEEGLKAKKLKEEQEAKAKKQKEEEEAKVKKQKEEEEAKAIKQKEEEELQAKELKDKQEAKAKKQKEEEAKAKKQKEEEEAKAKKLSEEEEAMAKKLKEEQDTKAKKQKEEEEAKVKEQKEEAEIKAKMQKEEKEAEAKKQKDEEAKTQKQKEEKEAKAKKLKEEQEAKAKKQKEEEAKAKKQKEEEEAKAKKLKEEEEAMAKKHKEEQDTKAKKQKEEEEEAKVKEQKEEAEIKSKKQKEETEAEAKKQKDEEEAKVKKQKEEKEAKAIKQKEEEGLRAKKLKEEQEAKAKKQKEEEEAKVKKQKEEEEAKAIKQKEEEEAMAKKLKEEQEAKAKKQKEEEEAKIKKQEEKEALKTKKLKEKQEAEAKKQKEEEEAKVKKKKEDEEAMAKKQKEEEDAMAKKLKEEKEAQAKKQKEEEAKIKKQKEEEEAKAIKQKEEAEAKKLREEQEAKEKKHKEEEEAKQNEEEAKAQKQKGEEELKVKKQKEEEEFKAKKLRDEKEAQAKKQKEEEAKIKKQKEEDEAKAIKQKEEAKSKMLKEEEEAKEKKQKQEEEVRFQKQKEEEEAKAKKQKEEEEIKAKKLKEEKEAKAKKQKKEEEAKAKKLKEEEEAKAKKQKEEEEAMAKKQKEEEDAMAKKLKEEKEAQAKKQKEEEAKIKKQKEEEEAKAIKQKEEAEAKKLREEQEAKEKKHKEEEEAKQNEEEAKAQKQKGEEEFKAKKLRDEKEAQAKKQKEEEAKIKKQKEEDEAKAIKQKKEAEAKKLKEEQEAKEKKQKEVEEAKNKKQKEEEEAKAKKQKEEAKAKKLKEEQEAKAKKQKEEEEAKAKKQAENGETKATTLTEVEENKLKKIKTKKQNEIEEAKNKAIEVDGTKVKKQKKEAKTTVQKQDREDDYENIQKKETQVIKEHELKTAKGSKTERTRVLKEIEVDENVMQEYKKFEENRQKEHIRFDKSVSDQTDEYSASSIKAKRERDILKAEDHETTNYSEGRSNIKKDTKSYQDRNVEEWVKSDSHREHKHDDGEKRKFVDHSHRDYTSEFARPSGYREKTYEADNFRLDTASKGITIYKAQTLVLDAQLRSSIPPLDMRKSEPSDRLDIKHRTKAVSEARSILSEKRSSVPRDVRRKPVFSTYLTDRTAVEGSRVKLTCSVLSSADPTITWYKNGVLIDNKLKYRTKYIDGLITLEVLNAAPVDSAEYNCTVENENGSVSTTAILKVYPSFEASPIPPTFTRSIRDNYHLAENELVLECRIRGQPLPSISWLKDDRPISTNERYQAYYLADGVCRLAISAPTPEDSGKYTCKAENSVWSDQINHVVSFTGKEAHLSPNIQTIERSRFTRQAMESRRPHFTNVLTDYKVAHGGTIGLQVEIRGCPTRVEWLREGKSVTDVYRNAKTFVEQGLYTLALSDVTEKETGLYTCRAWSTHGNVDMNAAITVVHPAEMDGKPAIIAGRPEKDVLISVGEDLNISFRVQGEPKPKVVFMKGTRDITTSQRVCKMTSDDYVKFTVKRSVISDAGTYCILARNAYGCDRAFVTVVVRQRASSENLISDWTYPLDDSAVSYVSRNYDSVPRIPSEPTVVDGGNNWVSLAWPKPDTTTPVLAYKVESWLLGKEGGARWTELGITPRNCFDVFNLKQGEQYHFRITLRNRYGWGESVQTSAAIGVGLSGGRPEFVDILPGQLKVLVGQKASLSCSVKGKPVPDVVWMKNGHEIEEDGRMIANFNGYNCSLEISDIRADDEARYSCEASNEHGRASTYARLAVVTDRLVWEADAKLKRERSSEVCGDYPPQFTMRLRDRRVQATYPVRLTCQVVGCPAPAVTWYKDGREVYKDNRHTHFKDELFHTLEIAPTTLEDGGVYEALARNSSGAVSCRCCLVVDKGIRAYVAPEFCCGLEPLYRLSEGEELRITAVVEAYPSVGVTWYRDGVRLRPSRRAVMTLDRDGQIELALAFVTSRDAGVYTCTASNEVGSASTSGKVDVLEGQMVERRAPPMLVSPDVPYSKEPMFVRKPRSSEAYEGDTVIIECEVIGDPKPDVYWLRDFLKPDYYRDATHFKRIGAGPEYRFEIPHAKLDYTGAYSVVARNVHGEAKAIISLQILAKDLSSNDDSHNVRYGRVDVIPRFERNLTDLLSYDGDAVEFECHLSGNPLPDIRWYHYAELIRDCPYLECTFEDGTARLKIKQVTADDEGTYTCEASNSLGKASSSACLVVYPPGEPNTLCQRLRRPPALLSAASTPRSTPRSTPARSVSRTRTPGPELKRLSSPGRQMPPSFYTYPFNKVVEEGETVVFQCAVKGLPSPWATWDKDGIIVTPSSRITLKEKEEIRILEIEHVTIEDVGLYRISVENDYGRAEGSARLEVITQKGKFYAGVRAYSASPRRSAPYRRRCPSNSKD
ncbi:uncharacterized protein isoform X9 [Choristoneura fumiferana]|uniref:uncharacterized protein isoform X9 n=1 Tax=Choristoneura fumiferana TaxID=7141 RepID=UPI003D15CAB3